jgi:hypothetical protein
MSCIGIIFVWNSMEVGMACIGIMFVWNSVEVGMACIGIMLYGIQWELAWPALA